MIKRCILLGLFVAFACSDGAPQYLDRAAMMDPAACKDCHEQHYIEWSGSMHAYASKDPVFLAMNARGQRETNGALGDFCVQCHAPLALRLGLTTDGLNLADVPEYAQGITCFFCHTVEAVEGSHNAPLRLSGDLVMRGGYDDPVPNTAHASKYSSLLDRNSKDSADLCGSCHDIVTPSGVHLERTFLEWKESLFANENIAPPQTCGDCHMAGRNDVAADYDGVFLRRVHDHKMVGVDTALTPFPEMESQLAAIEKDLSTTVYARICVYDDEEPARVRVLLENMAAGHSWPSGATQDRRAWVEVVAYGADDEVIFESGVVAKGQPLTELDDPNLWRIGDRTYNAAGEEVHMFWEVDSVVSNLLEAPNTFNVLDPEYKDVHQEREYILGDVKPERVKMRVRIRSMGLDLLDDLIASGDLDPAIRDQIPTFTLGTTQLTWTPDAGKVCIPEDHTDP